MTKPPELFSPERPIRSDFARQGGVAGGVPYVVRRLVTLLVFVALLIGGGFWFWHHFAAAPGEIPTIKAEGAYKEKPDQPGGIDIPHQDVQVYHEIDGSMPDANAKPTIEHMLPPPEQPMAAAMTTPAPTSADMPAAPPIEDLPPVVAAQTTEGEVPAAATPAPVLAPAVVAKLRPLPVATPVVPPAPVAATPAMPAASAATAGTVVQLASMPNAAAAATAAQNLQSKYSAILGTAHLHPVHADLGAKGIYYRIQSQPLADQQAQSICAALKKQSAGCILVRP